MTKAKSGEHFEELFERLNGLVRRLEDGGLPLDDAIATYEEGMTLVMRCRDVLTSAELRITRLHEQFAPDGEGGGS